MPSKKEHKLISKNRSAHHEYFIDETIECGVELAGAEVKSIRERACQITDTFAIIRGGEGYALVPLELYFNDSGRVKLLLGLGRGKKLYDKREDMAKRDVQREIDRALKTRLRG